MRTLNNVLKAAAILPLASLMAMPTAFAQTAEEKGLEISKEAKARDFGWKDSSAQMTMTLRNSQGQESVRQISIKSLEVEGDGDKGLTVFNEPKDVKGTAFLSFSHAVGADEQWLYLPALKRVKRISSRNKSGPFMGSEFAYEDLSSFEIEKYTYKYLGLEPCPAGECFAVEQYPLDKNSGYTRRIVHIDQDEYRTWKVDFYDRKDALLKTLIFDDYNQYLGKHWRAHLQKMVNHQSGKSTDLVWSEYSFQSGLTDADFNKNTLKRAR